MVGYLLLASNSQAGLFDKAPQPIILGAGTDREAAFKNLFLNENLGRTGGQTALLIFNALAGGGTGAIKNYEVTPVENYRELVTADLKMVAEALAQDLKKN